MILSSIKITKKEMFENRNKIFEDSRKLGKLFDGMELIFKFPDEMEQREKLFKLDDEFKEKMDCTVDESLKSYREQIERIMKVMALFLTYLCAFGTPGNFEKTLNRVGNMLSIITMNMYLEAIKEGGGPDEDQNS